MLFRSDLALVATPDCSRLIIDIVDKKMRKLIEKHVIKQTHKNAPWIANSFNLIE